MTASLAVVVVQTSSAASSFVGLTGVWVPQLSLLLLSSVYVLLGKVDRSLLRPAGLGTAFKTAPAAVAAAFTSSLAVSLAFTPDRRYVELVVSLSPKNLEELAAFVLLSFMLTAPAEEILFRGFIHVKLRNALGQPTALIASSTIFAVAHLDVYRLLPTLFIGLFTAYSLDKSKSLTPPIIVHAVNNSAYYIYAYWAYHS
ncbi:MAG: CPBP family intramembrane glutamic endopeptidase [Candidatus Caldarchaeum sp.]